MNQLNNWLIMATVTGTNMFLDEYDPNRPPVDSDWRLQPRFALHTTEHSARAIASRCALCGYHGAKVIQLPEAISLAE